MDATHYLTLDELIAERDEVDPDTAEVLARAAELFEALGVPDHDVWTWMKDNHLVLSGAVPGRLFTANVLTRTSNGDAIWTLYENTQVAIRQHSGRPTMATITPVAEPRDDAAPFSATLYFPSRTSSLGVDITGSTYQDFYDDV